MIEPVSRVQNYNTQRVNSASGKNAGQGNSAPFSMDQAIAEESARDEGVFYDHSTKAKESDKQTKEAHAKETESDSIIEKPNPDAPLGAIDTKKLLNGIKEFLANVWSNILRIFGNIWESKPLNDGAQAPEKSEDMIDPLHTQDSLNFYKGTTDDTSSSIPEDGFDANIDRLAEEGADSTASDEGSAPISTVAEDHIKPYEDKAIKDALMSGDEARFEKLITRGGERRAAISSTLLTQYDSKGRIIQIDPSDENLILHGTERTIRKRN